jgi:ferredoxin
MKTITEQKALEEIEQMLEKDHKIYLIGCGTCATMCRTGGKKEVLQMKDYLLGKGKEVTGWMVIPTACDELTGEAIRQENKRIDEADSILVMTCAFGVQTVSSYLEKPVCPALNTLFIGKVDVEGTFSEICKQCGECVLGQTAGICPVTTCAKGLLNGPCGGTNKGKCEVDKDKDCAWTLIYNRLKQMGKLDDIRQIHPPKNYGIKTLKKYSIKET